jgi:superfamily II DNA or RNA helicase
LPGQPPLSGRRHPPGAHDRSAVIGTGYRTPFTVVSPDGLAPGLHGLDVGLRPYQADAVAAITAALRDGGCCQLLAACGTGKTYIASRVAAGLAGDALVAVLVPSIALAAQTITAWQAGCLVEQVLAVCSDYTVGGGGVRAADLPVPVTTDAEVIAKWLADTCGRALIVCTYDSAHRLAEGLRRAGQAAGLVVCDEAHRLAGQAGKPTAAILQPGFLPEVRRLYMTATPRIGTGISPGGKLLVTSMDDEKIFGPVAYSYPFSRAIAEGWLKGYRLVVAAITDAHLSELLDSPDGRSLVAEGGVGLRMAAAQAALAMTAARFGLRRTLAFLPRIDSARQFTQTLPATLGMLAPRHRPDGPLSAAHVHGRMTSLQRELVLDRLRHPPEGGWSVVANARCLSEGIDVPAIDSVLFGAPKHSVTDIVQIAGRALRPHGDTQTATIIVPALLPDHPGDPDDGRGDEEGSPYQHILTVVRALCAHDETLTAALAHTRATQGETGEAELPGQIVVQAPPGLLGKTLDALRVRIINGTTSSWWEGYGHARAYHDQHGNLDVPTRYITPGGFRLGVWLNSQRTQRNSGTLPADRIELLNQAGIVWDRLEAAWMNAYQQLLAFAEVHGHFEVPVDYTTAEGIKLAEWQSTQRDARRTGKLTPARQALLDAAGFPWDPAQARWTRRYHQLTSALARHGNPGNLPPGSPEATWLAGQYLAWHHGKLPADKIALLEQAGVQLRRPDRWLACYHALLAFQAAHGHLRIPDGYTTTDGINLSDWQRDQRVRRKTGRMTPGQQQLLDDAGFCWDPATHAWNAYYQQALEWKQEHGHLQLPRKHPVKEWLNRQQKNHRQGNLAADQVALLHDLGALTSQTTPDT